MNKIDICNNIRGLCDKMTDIGYLKQEITEDFFESYNGDNEDDIHRIAYEFNRHASLNRILDHCIFEAKELLKEICKAVTDND